MERPKILEGVELKNHDKPLYFVSKSLEELEEVLREYEIDNTVSFVINKTDGKLNQNDGKASII